MPWARHAWMYLLASALFLGCESSPPSSEPPDASTDAGPPDAGVVWDGTATPLEELGDLPDTGRLAACGIITDGGVSERCGDLGTFDLSRCDRDSLASVTPGGHYNQTLRTEANGTLFGGSVIFSGDGGLGLLNGSPLTEVQQDARTLLFSERVTLADGGTVRRAYAACESSGGADFTGCFATCTNGRVTGRGSTFRATRLTWRAGEGESAGLQLVSERRVNLGWPVDVYVTRGHAYVVSIDNRNGAGAGGLSVFNVEDKTAPVLEKVVALGNDSNWNGVWARGDALYVASDKQGVLLFDISEPANPRFVRNLPGEAINAHTVFADGDRLYSATTHGSGVLIFDISTPTAPVLLNRYLAPSPHPFPYPHDMFARGGQLYVSHGYAGYVVADASNPSDIRTLGTYTFRNQYSHATAVGTFAGRTIAFEGGENADAHLRVLDITDPAHIVKIGEFRLRSDISIHNMVLVGSRLYLAWYQEGVRVLDVSNPTRPTQVAYFNTYRESDPGRSDFLDGASGIRVPGDGYLYVVDKSRGLLILREE
ncbi:LVIVD repeat-containing protein [Pyxidicoccus sp. 3LFB2]